MSAVLFVGDDPSRSRLFRAILERPGLTVYEAASGHEALELAQEGSGRT